MKWEYDYLYPVDRIEKLDDIIATMKLMGQDDWELVSVNNGIAYFKRAINIKPIYDKGTLVGYTDTDK